MRAKQQTLRVSFVFFRLKCQKQTRVLQRQTVPRRALKTNQIPEPRLNPTPCYIWLVVWTIFYFPRNIGLLSSSQLTNSNLFQRGSNHQPVRDGHVISLSIDSSYHYPQILIFFREVAWPHQAVFTLTRSCNSLSHPSALSLISSLYSPKRTCKTAYC